MEGLFYKAKPFLCVVAGVATFCIHGVGLIGQVSALILVGCGALIFHHRKNARGATTTRDNKRGRPGSRVR